MFNIQFGCSNSAQVETARFYTGRKEMETLYITKQEIPQLIAFLNDVRLMPAEEFKTIMEELEK